MHQWERVLYGVVDTDDDLGENFQDALEELNTSIVEFAELSGVSKSILYKISSGHRQNIQLENFRRIIRTIRRIEQGRDHDERVVAIITNRGSLENLKTVHEIDGIELRLREYPCSTVEEAIRQSILAERDGVDAIICGPITAYTVEDIVHTPVIGLSVETNQVVEALQLAVKKTMQ
jgi:predicted transcriptional regulator